MKKKQNKPEEKPEEKLERCVISDPVVRYVVLCKDGSGTDGVAYCDKKLAEKSRVAADHGAWCKECSPHRIVELREVQNG